jgi:hypothetical protein
MFFGSETRDETNNPGVTLMGTAFRFDAAQSDSTESLAQMCNS